ncbi:MAG: glycosyltransferase family 2 protein [Bacteroidales bacterium]|nr:glycosyltransferase family 2 protein [Bacteroidales bacterium]
MEKVSVIVPVYKVEKYIRRCVDSIVLQTYKNIEVILVDDGSPDQCGDICDDYANKYSYIKVIHQENRGQAAARNTGVSFSTGDYVTFVDSDDFITSDYVETLVGLVSRYGTDVAIAGFVYQYEDKPIKHSLSNIDEGFMSTEDVLRSMNYGSRGMGCIACVKLYRKKLLEQYPEPEGKIYEDLATTYKIIGAVDKVAWSSKKIYYWMQRKGSTMHSMFDSKHLYGLTAAQEQIEYLKTYYPTCVLSGKARYMGKIAELMSIVLHSSNGRDRKDNYFLLRDRMIYYDDVMTDPLVKRTQKIRLMSIKSGYWLSMAVFYMHESIKKRRN